MALNHETVRKLAAAYTAAWNSSSPEAVASFYASQQSGSQHGEPGWQHAAPGTQQVCEAGREKRPAQAVPPMDNNAARAAPRKYLLCMGNSNGMI